MDDVAVGDVDQAFPGPLVVGHPVSGHPSVHAFFGDPEMRHHPISVHRIVWWEKQDESGDVGGACQVESRVAFAPLQGGQVDGLVTFGPDVHGHPPDGPLDPLVQPQLTECVFFGRVDPGAVGCGPHLLDRHRHPQAGVGFPPHLLIQPVILGVGPVDDRVERRVGLFPG